MPSIRRTFPLVVLLLLPSLILAQSDEANSKTEIVNQIIKQTSVEDELLAPVDDLQSQFSQNPFGLPAETNEQLMKLYEESFDQDSVMRSIRQTFLDEYNTDFAKAVTDWMQKEDVRKVLEQESKYYTLQGKRERIVHKYELEQDPPSSDRNKLMENLVQQMSAAEMEIESRVIIFRTMVMAFSEISDQRSFSEQQIQGFTDNFRNQISMQINQQLAEQMLVKYHGLDNSVLQPYVSFFDTEAGTWLKKTTSQAVQNAIQQSADKFLDSLDNL